MSRYSLVLLAGGLIAKALLVGATKFVDSPVLLSLLTDCDPVAFEFANWASSLVFDQRRIAPGPGEARFFEALVVVGFGIECWLIGLFVRWLLRRLGATP